MKRTTLLISKCFHLTRTQAQHSPIDWENECDTIHEYRMNFLFIFVKFIRSQMSRLDPVCVCSIRNTCMRNFPSPPIRISLANWLMFAPNRKTVSLFCDLLYFCLLHSAFTLCVPRVHTVVVAIFCSLSLFLSVFWFEVWKPHSRLDNVCIVWMELLTLIGQDIHTLVFCSKTKQNKIKMNSQLVDWMKIVRW